MQLLVGEGYGGWEIDEGRAFGRTLRAGGWGMVKGSRVLREHGIT